MDNLIERYCSTGNNPNDWEWDELSNEVLNTFSLDITSENNRINSKDELQDMVIKGANSILSFKKETVDEDIFAQFQKWVVFRTIDEKWREHLAAMDQLREGIGLRAYGQKNPLIEYKQEGFGMFAEMMVETNQETLKRIFRSNIQQTGQKRAPLRPIPGNLKMQHDETAGMGFIAPPKGVRQGSQPQATANNQQQPQPISIGEKIGRNDPCPCGSEKKYKKCCGKTA